MLTQTYRGWTIDKVVTTTFDVLGKTKNVVTHYEAYPSWGGSHRGAMSDTIEQYEISQVKAVIDNIES